MLALFFDMSALVNLNAIGVLLSYSTVGVTLLIMRYNGMGEEIVVIIRVKRKNREPKRLSRTSKGEVGFVNRALEVEEEEIRRHSQHSQHHFTPNSPLQFNTGEGDLYMTNGSRSVLTRGITDETLACAITEKVSLVFSRCFEIQPFAVVL